MRSRSRRERGGFFVAFAPSHHRPRHPGDLVGERDGRDLRWSPRQQRREPRPMAGAMDFGIADHSQCACREQPGSGRSRPSRRPSPATGAWTSSDRQKGRVLTRSCCTSIRMSISGGGFRLTPASGSSPRSSHISKEAIRRRSGPVWNSGSRHRTQSKSMPGGL